MKFYPKTEEHEATQSPDVSRSSKTTPVNVRYHGDVHVLVCCSLVLVVYKALKQAACMDAGQWSLAFRPGSQYDVR